MLLYIGTEMCGILLKKVIVYNSNSWIEQKTKSHIDMSLQKSPEQVSSFYFQK